MILLMLVDHHLIQAFFRLQANYTTIVLFVIFRFVEVTTALWTISIKK